jgi:hypothetical protein
MSGRATLQSIARSGHRKNFPLICRAAARRAAASHCRLASGLWWCGYGITTSAPPEPCLWPNAEKQARYRERHLGVDGEKVRVGLNLNAGTRAKMGRLARHRGYTITALVEELVERAERRVTARLPSRALKAYYNAE